MGTPFSNSHCHACVWEGKIGGVVSKSWKEKSSQEKGGVASYSRIWTWLVSSVELSVKRGEARESEARIVELVGDL